MSLRVLTCPKCGAPLPGSARRGVFLCTFCGASVTADSEVVHAAKYRRALARLDEDAERDGLPRLAGLPYRVVGRIAVGASADVFLAERARRLGERVVLKVARDANGSARLAREAEVLDAIARSHAPGAAHFARLVPERVHAAPIPLDGERSVAVRRFKSGFVHTFEDIARAYPSGVPPEHAVWMWRRVLEVLSFLHGAGIAHGAPTPAHLLVHAREHGVMLVGFASARAREDASAADDDLVLAARSIDYVLGGRGMPGALGPLLARFVEGDRAAFPTHDALRLRELVGEAAEAVFGPPRFHPFHVP